jgi:hypothetical protein
MFPVLFSPNVNAAGFASMLVVLAVAGFFSIRVWNQGIHVDDRGVRVQGVFTSRRLAWAEIKHFELRQGCPT